MQQSRPPDPRRSAPDRSRCRATPRARPACGRRRRGGGSGSGRHRAAPPAPGRTTGVRPSSSSSATPAQRVRPRDDAAQLGELPLAGWLGRVCGVGASQVRCPRLDLQAEARGEAGGTQQPQWVPLEGGVGGDAQEPCLEVAAAPGWVDRLAPGERDRDRVDGEVPFRAGRPRSSPPAERRRRPASCSAATARQVACSLGELEGRAPGDPGDRASRVLLAPGLDRQVDVRHDLPSSGVADRPADDPDRAGLLSSAVRAGRDRGARRRGAPPASGSLHHLARDALPRSRR